MPLLYESVFPAQVKQLKHKYRPRLLQQVTEAPRWRVVEEYGVSSIYMTADDLKKTIKTNLEKACVEKGATLDYFRVLEMRAVWKILYTEYYCKYEAYISGHSPLAHAVVILVLAILLTALIIFAIWLVYRYIIEPIFGAVPPELRPGLAVGVAIGVTLLLAGGGIYLATRWRKKT